MLMPSVVSFESAKSTSTTLSISTKPLQSSTAGKITFVFKRIHTTNDIPYQTHMPLYVIVFIIVRLLCAIFLEMDIVIICGNFSDCQKQSYMVVNQKSLYGEYEKGRVAPFFSIYYTKLLCINVKNLNR